MTEENANKMDWVLLMRQQIMAVQPGPDAFGLHFKSGMTLGIFKTPDGFDVKMFRSSRPPDLETCVEEIVLNVNSKDFLVMPTVVATTPEIKA